MNIKDTARALYARTITADGDTLDLSGQPAEVGYLIPLPDLTVTVGAVTPDAVERFILSNLEILRQSGYLVGVSTATGRGVLTVQANLLRQRDAEWFAEVTAQLGYFDVTRGRNHRIES